MSKDWKLGRKFVDPTRLTRKVFDKHVDQMKVKRERDLINSRADFAALIKRLINLEEQLTHLTEHVRQHCDRIRIEMELDEGEHKDA